MVKEVAPRAYSVSELNFYLREYLGEDDLLTSIAVKGEVSGFRCHSSGHIYFTLRDVDCSIRIVMFRRYAANLNWEPHDGEQLVAVGRVSVYERDATCQLYAEVLFPAGIGGQSRSLAELKQRLEEEGLFSLERKRPLPKFPVSIGVVTAADSAAWADISRIIRMRAPHVKLKLYPALVQGDGSPISVSAALEKADRGQHDVLICGRGGGAGEDLAAFDTELVVRAIAALNTPLISAVGHESDFSLADLAADVRAATPTHAATLAVPDRMELLALLDDYAQRLQQTVTERLRLSRWKLDELSGMLTDSIHVGLAAAKQRLTADASQLELLNPLTILNRGYAMATDTSGRLLTDAAQTTVGENIEIRLSHGSLLAQVEKISREI